MIVGITVLPARLTRVAPAGTCTPAPACTILAPSTTSVAVLDRALPSPTISRAPSYAVTCARAGSGDPQSNGSGHRRRNGGGIHRRMDASLVNLNGYAACLAICFFSRG